MLGYGVAWDPEFFDELSTWLDEQKELVQREGGQWEHRGINVMGDTLRVQPNGAKRKGGPTYRWLLKGNTCTVLIMNRTEPSQQTPNVIVEMNGDQCMEHMRGDWAHDHIQHVVATICGAHRGSKMEFEKLSRVDVCVDLPGTSVNQFAELWQQNKFITRAKKATVHETEQEVMKFDIHHYGRTIEGLSIGRGGKRMLRIYDKKRETAHNEAKRERMIRYRWGKEPECATRLEYQLRRDALKEYEVESWQDWMKKRAAIVRHLNSEWFRFVKARDPNNTARSKTHPLWETVQQAFAEWTGQPASIIRIARKAVTVAPIQMIRQAKGCILRGLVQLGKATSILEDGEDVTEAAVRVMLPMIVEEFRSDPLIRQRLFLKHAESS